MGTALRGWNQVYVGLRCYFTALGQPLNSPVDRLGFTGETDSKWLFRNYRVIDSGIRKIVGDAVLVEPLLFLTLFLIVQRDA